MRHALLPALTALLALAACGPANKPVPDAGPDTSCGLDCAAQSHFGLQVGRCFEYSGNATSKDDPPALGLWVRPVFTLEGGVKVLPVEYRVTGQTKMIDSFFFKDGELYLARREFSTTGQSVTYRDAANAIVGVKWLDQASAGGETYTTDAQAYVVGRSGAGTTDPVTYQVTTFAGTASDQKSPLQPYPNALKLVFGDTTHGADARRVYVPDVGFSIIATNFVLSGPAATPVYLQQVRDVGDADAGQADCSLGSP